MVAPAPYLVLRLLLQLAFFTWAALVFFDAPRLTGVLKSVVATFLYFLVVVSVVGAFVLPRILPLLRGG